MQDYKIQVEDLTKVFETKRGSIVAVQDLNFKVREKEFVSLVGPSGCGKSTIIRMLNGIIKPTKGKIIYSGVIYENGVKKEMLKKLGFVFQSPNLLPWLTVRKNLELPLEVFKLKGKKWNDNIEKLLNIVGVSKYVETYPNELSVSIQKRVGVIRAMVHEPEILFMDEPFGTLDEITREQLDMETLSIWKETGKTIIFITHNVEEAILLSSRVIVMCTDPGRIIQEVEIDLARPRTLDIITSQKFIKYEEQITNLIGKTDLDKIK